MDVFIFLNALYGVKLMDEAICIVRNICKDRYRCSGREWGKLLTRADLSKSSKVDLKKQCPDVSKVKIAKFIIVITL